MSPVKKKSTKKVTAKKAAPKKAAKKAVARSAASRRPVKKAAPKKAAAKKVVKKKAAVKKTATKKPVAKKKAAKKAPAGKAVSKKAAVKKSPAKKAAPAKKVTKKKATGRKTTTDPQSLNFSPYQSRKGEEYMNESQVEHFRQILANWKGDLMQEVDRTVTHMQDEATHFPDPNDRASQESEFSLELRTRDRERKLIRKIDETLAKLDSEEYGFCENCGVEIGIRRLEARPTATLCIDCKVLDEIREKQWR